MLSPPAVPVSVLVTSLAGQRTPGAAGKRIIPVSVIDIEVIGLVVPVGARCANAFMKTTIPPIPNNRNIFHKPLAIFPTTSALPRTTSR